MARRSSSRHWEQSTPDHFQDAEEERPLVLEGDPTLRTPTASRRSSDATSSSTGAGRTVRLATARDFLASSHLTISTIEDVEVAVFPDSGKTFARAHRLGSGGVSLMNREEANLDYSTASSDRYPGVIPEHWPSPSVASFDRGRGPSPLGARRGL